jgi:hypothetical protein
MIYQGDGFVMDNDNHSDYDLKEINLAIKRICVKGADELRKRLRITEQGFDILGRAHNSRGRDFYLYAVLDEIEKLGFTALRISEALSGYHEPDTNDEVGKRLSRNLLTVINDEQSLHIRKLTELLIELICFSTINKREYFDHYLLYRELDQCNKRKEDLKHYYNCENKNIQKRIELLKTSISEGEKLIQLAECWYLQKDKTGFPKHNGEAKFEGNFQVLLKKALQIANKDERVALGLDYETSFRQPSRSIHLNIGGMNPVITYDRLKAQIFKFGLLASLCLVRCRRLQGVRTSNGIVAGIAKNFPFKHYTDQVYRTHTNPGIIKGDFVVVRNLNLLGEVIETKKSDFGYRSFRVRFLQDHFHKEDWVTAPEVQLVAQGMKERKAIRDLLDGAEINPKIIAAKQRETILKLWQQLEDARRSKQALTRPSSS